MKRYIYIYIITIAAFDFKAQQDPQYSLYQFNQLVINPAYAGARDAIAVVMDARKQWVGFDGAPTTIGVSIHSPLLNQKLGGGLNLMSDQIGAKSITAAYGSFAYILKLSNRTKLSFGIRAGYLNYKFDFSKVNYKDATETTINDLSNANKGTLDIDAGLFLRSNSFFAGLSATHLNQSKLYTAEYTSLNASGTTQNYTTSYVLNPHLFFVLGKSFSFSDNFSFSPSINLRHIRAQNSLDINLNFFLQKKIWLGVYHKFDYGFGGLLQIYATDKLRIGYSYDTGFGGKKRLGASHEIMLGFDFGKYKSKTLSPRFL